MSAVIVAPSDAQLGMIWRLCDERGWALPDAVHSKTEASEIITGILNGSYNPDRYRVTTEYGGDYEGWDDVPF